MTGSRDCRPSLLATRSPPTVLTTRALAFGGDAALLLTLGLLAPAVIVICVPVVGAHGFVGPIADDTVAGTAGAASAGQAHGTELARLWALVWGGKEIRRARVPRQPPLWDVQGTHGHTR